MTSEVDGEAPQTGPDARTQARAGLMLRLRAKITADLGLLRAIEAAPRENFIGPDQQVFAFRDIALPLPFGQTMEAPSELARALAALAPRKTSRVLEIGAGSGFSARVLSLLAAEVVTIDCFEALVVAAREKFERQGARNIAAIWANLAEVGPAFGRFDRILVNPAVESIPPNLIALLAEEGVLVAARKRPGAKNGELIRLVCCPDAEITLENLGATRAQNLISGVFPRQSG